MTKPKIPIHRITKQIPGRKREWFALSVMTYGVFFLSLMAFGITDRERGGYLCACSTPVQFWEYAQPSYRLGCWLGRNVDEPALYCPPRKPLSVEVDHEETE